RRESHDFLLVRFDLDALDEELCDPSPLLGDLAELAEACERVEVLEIRFSNEIEGADRVSRILEPLVQTSEACRDLSAFLDGGNQLELALERIGRLHQSVTRLLQVRDGLEGRATGGIQIGEDELVARDGGVDVTHAFRQELSLAERDPRLLRPVARVLPQAT